MWFPEIATETVALLNFKQLVSTRATKYKNHSATCL